MEGYISCIGQRKIGKVKAKHKMIRSRQMKNFDKDLFLQDLASYDWFSVVNSADSVDEAVNKWSELVSLVIEKYAPIRERRVTGRFFVLGLPHP